MSDSQPGAGYAPPWNHQQALAELRARAERRQNVTHSLPADTPDAVQQLVQDLQVHQIELEMQYEELLLAQAEAEHLRQQYESLYEFAPVGYCTVGADSVVEQLNLRGSQLLGAPRAALLGRRLALFVALQDRELFNDYLARLLHEGTRQTISVKMTREGHMPIQVRIEGQAAEAEDGRLVMRLALTDVTEQHQTRKALEISEKRFRVLFERSGDGMLLMRDNRFVDCNDAALRLLSLSRKEELLGQHASAFSPEKQPNGQYSRLQANAYWEEALRKGYCRFEWCRLRATGEQFWEDVLLTAIPDPGTDDFLVHAAWRDITHEKLAAARVRESEERLKMALHASETGVWTIDYTTDLVHWDLRCQSIFGRAFDPNPAPFQLIKDAIHPDDFAGVSAALQRSAREHAPFDLEHRVVWPDGTVRHVSTVGKVLPGPPGQPGSFVGLMRDITRRQEAEQELHYKNQLLGHILAQLPVILGRLTPEGKYVELVGRGLRRLRVQDNELVGHSVSEVFPSLAGPVRPLLAGEEVSFVDVDTHTGQALYFQNYGFFDAQRQQAILFAIDVTETEQSRAQLRAEKEFTQSLLNNTVDCVVALDTELRVTAWNARVAELVKLPEAEALGRPYHEVLDGLATDPAVQRCIERALAGAASEHLNWAGRTPRVVLDLNFVPLYSQGAVSGVLLVGRDVTERNRLEEEATGLKLRQQQEVLAAILQTQEAERKRIAEALHNGVGQLLYATKLHLENSPKTGKEGPGAMALLDEAIKMTRMISFELTPGILEDFGLMYALEELLRRIPRQSLQVHLQAEGLEQPLPPLLEVAVYRIVQELLNNIIKHAQAQEAFIYVTREADRLLVSVEDNGRGFDDANRETPRGGIGLPGLRNRISLLGGTFHISSRAGQGTIVNIELPVR